MKVNLEILEAAYLFGKESIENLSTKELVPKMVIRRRLTPAAKIVVELLNKIEFNNHRVFYGTNYGELNASSKILNSILYEDILSPTDFQNSVYNTAVSYASILNKNYSEILTTSSGDETSQKLLKLGAIKALDKDEVVLICTETINIKNINQINKCIDYLESGVVLKLKISEEEASIKYEGIRNKGFPKSIDEMLTIAKAFDKDKKNIIEVKL
ncbi:beta-ketoacyl synthase chain length factor [Halarcobacter ebronensis]|uniref:Beta-ketoacyl synthase-like N-terminal domain-containing protein n=1 Tax=Halarcobacter ebronensis TaxID=1462615 RepID=A0A4Q1ARN6_9BACT|nr:beta-ketoacyl synthase chain length factor [Halarcobacter ebronensis]QKF83500.1 beta-ketoacyl synthase domain-containing protein [Halarcobacter ebronensis]RXK08294.1 hypothetical protein CRV07_00370 [Halarcobacter ebronensis]